MPPVDLTYQNGEKHGGVDADLAPGYVRKMKNAVYLPHDQKNPYKIPGRTLATALPAGATSANSKGLVYLQYENGADRLVAYFNSKFSETPASAPGVFTDAVDRAASVYTRTGSWLRSIIDGYGCHILWTGSGANERPLLRDEDGNWRPLSLKAPGSPSLAPTITTPSVIRPDASAAVAGYANSWTDPTKVYDNDLASKMYCARSSAGTNAIDITFTDVGTTGTGGYKLNLRLATSSLPPSDWDPPLDGGGDSEPVVASLIIKLSTTGTAGTFTTIFQQNAPVALSDVQYDLPNNINWTDIVVRCMFTYTSGTAQAGGQVYEIYAQEAAAGGSTTIAAGTYYYAVTEVWEVFLASGKSRFVESAPSPTVSLAITEPVTAVGILVTLPAVANGTADGILHAAPSRLHYRKLYRSTKSGTYPNLGCIAATIAIDATTYTDTFALDGDTLGSPGLNIGYLGITPYPIATQSPAFVDAVFHAGAVFAIPQDDPYTVAWTPPGFPDYWPVPQRTGPQQTERGEKGVGLASLGDYLLYFARTKVLRMTGFPWLSADSSTFDVKNIEVVELSPNEGLAGSPKSKCKIQTENGHAAYVWVSDSGIWMTDGFLPKDRGLGAVRLSITLDWNNDVDTARLAETELSFDPATQHLIFDYYDRAGVRQTAYFHTAQGHWVEGVPKLTSGHSTTAYSRAVGERSGVLKHWVLDAPNTRILNDRTGTDLAGSEILTHIESGWQSPIGPRQEFQVWGAALDHSDWGPGETCDLDLLTRTDESGAIQAASKHGLSLRGNRSTNAGLVEGSGQSLKFIIRHTGKTTSVGTPVRAFGTLHLEAEAVDEAR